MNCNTTHYRANSSSVPGDPTLLARPDDRHAYWAHANRQPRRRPVSLGDTLTSMLTNGLQQRWRLQARVVELLSQQLPADLCAELGLGSLHRGTLTLTVEAGAWAFHFDRRLSEALACCFEQLAPELGVRRVRFKVGGCSDQEWFKKGGGRSDERL